VNRFSDSTMQRFNHSTMTPRSLSVGAFVILLALAATLPCRAAGITNVTVANVTPSSFTVVANIDGLLSIDVFANSSGTSNLAGIVGVEFDPVHTGNAGLIAEHERRAHRGLLRSRARPLGLGHIRVSRLAPDTTYYFRLTTRLGNNATNVYPSAGFASVKTALETSFVRDAQQLVIDVPGLDNDGRIVTLTHSNAAFALAAVVGDGAGTNQVVFNTADLLALGGQTNFNASGSQEFLAELRGPESARTFEQFTLIFADAFNIAQATHESFGIEFAALSVGSTVMRAGDRGSLELSYNASVPVRQITAQLQIPTGLLTELALSNLPPPVASATIVSNSATAASLSLVMHPGQSLQGSLSLGQLWFRAVSNQTSAFIPVRLAGPQLAKLDGNSVSNVLAQAGRVVLIAEQPLLEAFAASGGAGLHVYGKPLVGYAIEYTPALGQPWRVARRVPMTNLVATLSNLHDSSGNYFYRAYEIQDVPEMDALTGANGTRRLLVFGKPGSSYTLQTKPILSAAVAWNPVLSYTLTNGFRYLDNLGTNTASTFYRLRKDS
jgi:hypothetical protein